MTSISEQPRAARMTTATAAVTGNQPPAVEAKILAIHVRRTLSFFPHLHLPPWIETKSRPVAEWVQFIISARGSSVRRTCWVHSLMWMGSLQSDEQSGQKVKSRTISGGGNKKRISVAKLESVKWLIESSPFHFVSKWTSIIFCAKLTASPTSGHVSLRHSLTWPAGEGLTYTISVIKFTRLCNSDWNLQFHVQHLHCSSNRLGIRREAAAERGKWALEWLVGRQMGGTSAAVKSGQEINSDTERGFTII